ncbi:IclR family transcriptional regulator [Albimonas pacifica]|uniref:Transcriptional regulator, IclR family n=1 Tax=Albimonas pacifica TaxID=1114924 RepID=A0A1I3FSD4_9RHOB|nr:IclR family transcriptional regulator [Albimonas pacifica]SFI14109.1 transcriptional regulator, IclR family [Albimonas pacifica]
MGGDMGGEDGKAPRGGVQSIERAAALLDGVAAAGPRGASLSALAERTGLNVSTAHHLCRTLEAEGFLARVGDSKRYRIGGRVFALAAGALDESALLSLGTPVLERLSADTGEAAHLAVRSGADIVLVARTAATGMLQLSERAGVIRPAHATAIGKMLLAACAPEDRARILAGLDLPRFTEATITDRARLAAELETVRAEGVAHDRQELDAEVRCVAVAVTDFAGRTAAAMGISGPVWRMQDAALEAKIARLKSAAAELSERLGAR